MLSQIIDHFLKASSNFFFYDEKIKRITLLISYGCFTFWLEHISQATAETFVSADGTHSSVSEAVCLGLFLVSSVEEDSPSYSGYRHNGCLSSVSRSVTPKTHISPVTALSPATKKKKKRRRRNSVSN